MTDRKHKMNRREFGISLGVSTTSLALFGSQARAAEAIKLRDLYNKDMSFSDLATSLEGQRVLVSGFMAPPFEAVSKFFVLTKIPMAVCPFCSLDADWPDDLLAVYTKRTVKVVNFNIRIEVRGLLELGSYTDEDTGFLSRVRLVDASYS